MKFHLEICSFVTIKPLAIFSPFLFKENYDFHCLLLYFNFKTFSKLFFFFLRSINKLYHDVAKYKIFAKLMFMQNWWSKNSILWRQFFLIHNAFFRRCLFCYSEEHLVMIKGNINMKLYKLNSIKKTEEPSQRFPY